MKGAILARDYILTSLFNIRYYHFLRARVCVTGWEECRRLQNKIYSKYEFVLLCSTRHTYRTAVTFSYVWVGVFLEREILEVLVMTMMYQHPS